MTLRRIPGLLRVVFAVSLLLAGSAAGEQGLVLFGSAGDSWASAGEEIRSLGGRVRHGYPGGGAIVDGDESFWIRADSRGGWTGYRNKLSASEQEGLSGMARLAALVWNDRFKAALPHPLGESDRPDPIEIRNGESVEPRSLPDNRQLKAPAGADSDDTSEFMLGSVAVGILMPESDGGIDPSTENWTQQMIDNVFLKVQAGLDWWIQHAPGGNLSFIYRLEDPIVTPYEPITQYNGWPFDTLWVGGLFDTLGYSVGNDREDASAYLNDLRDTLDTDWAVSIIVANSLVDADGRFDLSFNYAKAILGGPYFVMSYDVGPWGNANMDAVAAHEMGHMFWALDEYQFGAHNCGWYSGYEDAQNLNAIDGLGCTSNVQCIMRLDLANAFADDSVCVHTLNMIGMGDTDGDGIGNLLDTYPTALLDPIADSIGLFAPTLSGTSFVNPLTNLNRYIAGTDLTLNTIASVEYRIDGALWSPASAVDGAFDSAGEAFMFTTPALSETLHVLETRAINSVANAETLYAVDTFTVYDGESPGPVTSLQSSALDSSAVLTWVNPGDSDLLSIMIRVSTIANPVDTGDGSLLEIRPAALFAPDTLVHAGLLPDTVYYYSLFALDEVPNPSGAANVEAQPLWPPPPAALYSPAAGSLYVAIDPLFAWAPIELGNSLDTLIEYGLQISVDSLFQSVLIDTTASIGSPADTLAGVSPLAVGSSYWWRVRGKDLLTGTFGYWGEGSRFTTELPLTSVTFRDSVVSSYTNFISGDSLQTLTNAFIEVRFEPADTLSIGGHDGRLHWAASTADSVDLTFDRNEGGASYWRGVIQYESSFARGDTIEFWVSGRAPNRTALFDKNGGQNYNFIAGRNLLASYHTPVDFEPAPFTMRSPVYVTDTDSQIDLYVGTTPAGTITGGEVWYSVQSDTLQTVAPLVADTLMGGTDYWRGTIDSLFITSQIVEYYLKVWGDSTFDTTYVYGDDNATASSIRITEALADPYTFLIQSVTGIAGEPDAVPVAIPARSELLGNWPNPFNPSTTISFGLEKEGRVRLAIYDITGRLVRTIIDESRPAGWYGVIWDGRSERGGESASGVYFTRVRSGDWTETKRMILIR